MDDNGNQLSQAPYFGMVMMYPSAGVIERIGQDWDWVWIDGQHGQFGYDSILQAVRACDLIQRPAFVRVPGHESGTIGLVLDMGAHGVIVPCVDTPEQAEQLVRIAKFPPLGERSYGGRRVIDLRQRAYSDTANEETLLIAQIETPLAIENVEAIAAVPGIDALFLGPDDLLLRRGYSMIEPRTPEVLEADFIAVAQAAKKHQKKAVTVAIGAEMINLCLHCGFDYIVCGGDVPFLASGSAAASSMARESFEAFRERNEFRRDMPELIENHTPATAY